MRIVAGLLVEMHEIAAAAATGPMEVEGGSMPPVLVDDSSSVCDLVVGSASHTLRRISMLRHSRPRKPRKSVDAEKKTGGEFAIRDFLPPR